MAGGQTESKIVAGFKLPPRLTLADALQLPRPKAKAASKSSSAPVAGTRKGLPWTEDEHKLFLEGLQKLGKGNWRGIAKEFVTTRTPTQIASHAQKYSLRITGVTKRRSRFTALEQKVNGTQTAESASSKQSITPTPSGLPPFSWPPPLPLISTAGLGPADAAARAAPIISVAAAAAAAADVAAATMSAAATPPISDAAPPGSSSSTAGQPGVRTSPTIYNSGVQSAGGRQQAAGGSSFPAGSRQPTAVLRPKARLLDCPPSHAGAASECSSGRSVEHNKSGGRTLPASNSVLQPSLHSAFRAITSS